MGMIQFNGLFRGVKPSRQVIKTGEGLPGQYWPSRAVQF